ncbi:MAG: hypothetical protein DRP84_03840 [Spirochaetes bacterium]|nr:MAG: hypothetical protein DRP84_03840 [Spirochaetota bacterium]
MEGYLTNISEEVQNHLKQLASSVELPEGEDALDVLAKGWLEKEKLFMSKMEEENLEEVDTYSADEKQGGLILTYSGSLLRIGPMGEDGRNVEYYSIGLRTDVPEKAEKSGSVLEKNITIGEPMNFSVGPITKSSPVYKIAVVKEEMGPEKEEELLSEVTQILSDGFTEINKTILH